MCVCVFVSADEAESKRCPNFVCGKGLLRGHESLIWGYIKLKMRSTKTICPIFLCHSLYIVVAANSCATQKLHLSYVMCS